MRELADLFPPFLSPSRVRYSSPERLGRPSPPYRVVSVDLKLPEASHPGSEARRAVLSLPLAPFRPGMLTGAAPPPYAAASLLCSPLPRASSAFESVVLRARFPT